MTLRRSALALVALLSAPPAVAQDHAGDWTGTYVCAQGVTGLNLRLRPQGDGRLSGLFHFHPVPGHPQAAEGCYEVSATSRDAALTVSAGRWLLRPPDYVTVDLVGELDEDGTLYGHVEGPGCGLFALRRSAMPRPVPAACGAVISSRP